MNILPVSHAAPKWWRDDWAVRRTGVNRVMLGLLLGLMGGNAMAVRAERSIGEILSARTEESMARNLATVLQTRAIQLREIEAFPLQPTMRHRFDRFFWGRCGWGRSLVVEPRATKLPSDPMLVLGDGYLKCEKIRAALFEPGVAVESYPKGYFGDYEYEGWLVSDRFEFTDEAALQQIFQLLVETAKEPDTELDFYELAEFDGPELKLADYRKERGFRPELLFEFVGDKLLRVEVNLTARSMLVQADDKWDFYSVDRLSAVALRALLQAKRADQIHAADSHEI